MFQGTCVGGPLDRSEAVSRFPRGFLLADKPNGECWIYEWNDENEVFVVRSEEPMILMRDGPVNIHRAAEESNYDVLAAPW